MIRDWARKHKYISIGLLTVLVLLLGVLSYKYIQFQYRLIPIYMISEEMPYEEPYLLDEDSDIVKQIRAERIYCRVSSDRREILVRWKDAEKVIDRVFAAKQTS